MIDNKNKRLHFKKIKKINIYPIYEKLKINEIKHYKYKNNIWILLKGKDYLNYKFNS